MKQKISKVTLGIASLAILLTIPLTAGAANENDVVRSPLYRDGSISCGGADDTTKRGGQAVLLPQPGEVS